MSFGAASHDEGVDVVAVALEAARPLMRRLAAGIVCSIRLRFRYASVEFEDEVQELALMAVRTLRRYGVQDPEHARAVVLRLLPLWAFWRHCRLVRQFSARPDLTVSQITPDEIDGLKELSVSDERKIAEIDAEIDAWEIFQKSLLTEIEFEVLYSYLVNGASETRRRFRMTRSQLFVVLRRAIGILREGAHEDRVDRKDESG